ncbi:MULTISPECIES: DMT family transporter [Metabacillus]|uniref:DMT family transporter n=1 Tax=Metabacillus hrfriensis TaxID=3048891 RepID=A0ACD4RIH1_9BACI|nr:MULTISPECIES: DMT family transporter [Metabacillus]UAL54761.1 DMT family transporter [Metabacillus dongyingensis]WHZ60273.1 DMT family transporter [Metabacillus sp. CT-WN-B3]
MIENRNAYIAATIYAIIIGLSFMFVKVTLTVATPLDTLAHRFTIAWIAATVLFVLKKESIKATKKDVLRIALLAILYPTLFFAFQVFGLVHTSSSEAGIIQATIPIFTLIFASIILKETSTSSQKIAIGLSVLGVIYIMYMNGAGSTNTSLLGTGLILLSALTASLYNVFARKLTQRYSLFTITYFMTLFGFIAFNGLALTNHVMNGTVHQYMQPFGHWDFVLAILYLGILSSLGTSYLSNYALSKIDASKMSVFSNFATLITILAGVIFLKEEFHLYHIVGSIIIIIGVVGTNYFGARGKSNEKI